MDEPRKKTASSEEEPQGAQEVVALIKKVQEQLGFLEKKLDILINQSGDRPPRMGGDRDRGFSSRPPRPFGGQSRWQGRPPSRDGGRDFSQGRSFDQPPRDQGPRDRGSFSPRGRSFDRPQSGGESRGFDRKKKPFYRRDRD